MTVETLFFATLTVTVVYAFAFLKIASDLRQQQKDIANVESYLSNKIDTHILALIEYNMGSVELVKQLLERVENLENK